MTMQTEAIVRAADALLQPFSVGAVTHAPGRVEAVVKRENLCTAVRAIIDARWGYLSAITGLDHPWPKAAKPAAAAAPAPPPQAQTDQPMEDRLEALYHFVSGPIVATLRVSLPYHDARVPSVCGLIPSATLYERELMEMFGIIVEGTPDTSRLLLPDDWPDGVYPLRKSFKGLTA
jgi:NADH:ubiquinone oxidoreductase subunit C